MPPITAVLFAQDDAIRIGRALETLRFASEIVVVDRGGDSMVARIARQYGARVINIANLGSATSFPALSDWIFCLSPRESLADSLEAALLEWTLLPSTQANEKACYSIQVREELSSGWILHTEEETRLVPRTWPLSQRGLPEASAYAHPLGGELYRFAFP